jgi:hypothetical protein
VLLLTSVEEIEILPFFQDDRPTLINELKDKIFPIKSA